MAVGVEVGVGDGPGVGVRLGVGVGVTVGVFFSGHGLQQAIRSGVSLAQIGELSFVIAQIAGGGTLLLGGMVVTVSPIGGGPE